MLIESRVVESVTQYLIPAVLIYEALESWHNVRLYFESVSCVNTRSSNPSNHVIGIRVHISHHHDLNTPLRYIGLIGIEGI